MFKGLLNAKELDIDSDLDTDDETNKTEQVRKNSKVIEVDFLPCSSNQCDNLIFNKVNSNLLESSSDNLSFEEKDVKPRKNVDNVLKSPGQRKPQSYPYELKEGLLQSQINQAIGKGDVEKADLFNNQIMELDLKKKQEQMAKAEAFLKIREKRKQMKVKKRRKKLHWTFETKQRWETKSNM